MDAVPLKIQEDCPCSHFFVHLCEFCMCFTIILVASGCCNSSGCGYCVHQVDEFVIDSYKIRQGKVSIFEMEGKELREIYDEELEEYDDVICEDDLLSIAVYHPSRADLMKAVETINKDVGFRVYRGKIDLPTFQVLLLLGSHWKRPTSCFRSDTTNKSEVSRFS